MIGVPLHMLRETGVIRTQAFPTDWMEKTA